MKRLRAIEFIIARLVLNFKFAIDIQRILEVSTGQKFPALPGNFLVWTALPGPEPIYYKYFS